ncbi:MAG: 1,2-phenylacetyl-CoA epoxidase subunit PaaD [Panacagrimonas sp.]
MSEVAIRASIEEIWSWLADVPDPEIPAISIVDLGIVRELCWDQTRDPVRLVVTVTPTYSGCPATEVIASSIREMLEQHGIEQPVLQTRLSPAWTTDWLAPAARKKLRVYGITPPAEQASEQVIDISRITRRAMSAPKVTCPRCGSHDTELTSQFGSTPCKALYRCKACREPFDYFKSH